MRSARTSMIRALVCEESVTIPACEPVSEIAVVAHVVDRHRAERARDPLPGREQHVHLALQRPRRDLVGGVDELVGGLAPRREHRDDLLAALARGDDPARGALDVLGLGDGGAAELHHDDLGHSRAENTIARRMADSSGAQRGSRRLAAGRSRSRSRPRPRRSSSSSCCASVIGRRRRRPTAAEPARARGRRSPTGPIAGMSAAGAGRPGAAGRLRRRRRRRSPFLDQVRIHQLGGVLVDSRNWTDAATGTRAGQRAARGRARGRPDPAAARRAPRRAAPTARSPTCRRSRPSSRSATPARPSATEDWARDAGAALRTAGFDLDLFPVADVATLDSPLADRAFSDDPETVAELTAAAIRGCRDGGDRLRAAVTSRASAPPRRTPTAARRP